MADILAGEIVTAARLNRLRPTRETAVCSSDLTGAVTDTDVPGATITLTTATNGAEFEAVAFIDFNPTSTSIGIGKLVVDSVIQSGEAHLQSPSASSTRGTTGMVWSGSLATAGSHTLKLTATLPASFQIRQTHTKLYVAVYEVV